MKQKAVIKISLILKKITITEGKVKSLFRYLILKSDKLQMNFLNFSNLFNFFNLLLL